MLSFLLAAFSVAQQGAAGYGQGGGQGGGGFGGGGSFRGGRPGGGAGESNEPAYNRKTKPDEDETQDLWETRTAVLTPGDRVEFKLKIKPGQTILAGATSDAFDPALDIEDSKGTVLAKNDDRAEGDQSPFIVYRFATEGTYTLKVLSYRSVSGGKFTLKMRSFLASDAALGAVKHADVAQASTQGYGRVVFRLGAKKGQIYDLRNVFGVDGRTGKYGCSLVRIIGPTGVELSDFEVIPTSDGTPVFKALGDGDYYVEYTTQPNLKEFETDFRAVQVSSVSVTSETILQMDRGELRIVELPVKPDQIVRTTLIGSITFDMSAPAADTVGAEITAGDDSYGNTKNWLWFKVNRDSDADVIRVFHGTGMARLAFRSQSPAIQGVTIKNVESLPTWETGDPVKSSIEIGDSRLFLIKSAKSELMRVAATAAHFQPRLDIFRLNGDLANTLIDRKKHTAGDDLYFPDQDTFLVRLSCDGHGGSGDFAMKRDVLSPAAYLLGNVQTMTLDGANFGLYSVNLEAGKRYELMIDEPQKFLRADLLDDDGQFLTSQRIDFDKVEVQYFVPTRSGRHRLWLRGTPGVRHFKFQLHVPPTVGG